MAANIRALPIKLCGVVQIPEYFQKLRIRILVGVKSDLDSLGMARLVLADLFV